MRAWYAVHTISGHENKVKQILTRRAEKEGYWGIFISEILIPTEQELTTRSGKRRIVDKKVFPGYILVKMDLNDEVYKLVRRTSGVTGFVQSGNKPVPLEQYEVDRILRNLEASQNMPKVAFEKDDIIRVVTGPFADYTGKIEEVNRDREKLKVMISMFGRDTAIELEFDQVEKQ